MIRIVGVQRDSSPEREFVLLQNQGSLRQKLRGHLVASESIFGGHTPEDASFGFCDDELIPPGMFVILFTGCGTPRWAKTKEGQMIYYCYMERTSPVWHYRPGSIHLLATQHTLAERPPALMLT